MAAAGVGYGLLHPLDDLGLDPADITQRASDAYDTQHADARHTGTRL